MGKQTKKSKNQLYDQPWKHAAGAVIGFGLAYAGASWAIDSGSLLAYFVTILVLLLAVSHVVRALHMQYGQRAK